MGVIFKRFHPDSFCLKCKIYFICEIGAFSAENNNQLEKCPNIRQMRVKN